MNFIFLGAQEQEVWKSFIPVIGPIVAALITTIGVIWTARSSLKKLKIDQKATPTELTRYKEWLEVAEKYKSVYMKQDPYGPDYGGQWNNIKRSCEAALHAASWERIVLNETPQGSAQKKLLKLDSAYVASKILIKTNNGNAHPVEVPNFQGKVSNIVAHIFSIFVALLLILILGLLWERIFGLAFLLMILCFILWIFFTSILHSIWEKPKVYFRKIALAHGAKIQDSTHADRFFRIRGSFLDDLSNDVCLPSENRRLWGPICHFIILCPPVIWWASRSKKYNFGYMKEELESKKKAKHN